MIWDANLSLNTEKFSEEFARMTIYLMMDFFSGYNQVPLHEKLCDMMMFQTLLGLLWMITLSQEVMNLVSQFCWAIGLVLESNISYNCLAYLDDLGVKRSKTKYGMKEVFSGICQYIFEYLKYLDYILVSIKLAGMKVLEEKIF